MYEGGPSKRNKKRKISPPYEHKNKYSDLETDSDEDESFTEHIISEKVKDKPVPIVIDTANLSQEKILNIQWTMKAVDEEMVYIYNKTRMTYLTNGKEVHQQASKFLVDVTVNITVKKISTRDPATPIYLVFLKFETEVKRLLKIKYICSVKIKWLKFKNTRLATQGYNCQSFGHSSSHCHHKTKCVKCSGEHKAKDCLLKDEDKPTCANCGKGNPANHTGCKKYIKHIETIKKRQAERKNKIHIREPPGN